MALLARLTGYIAVNTKRLVAMIIYVDCVAGIRLDPIKFYPARDFSRECHLPAPVGIVLKARGRETSRHLVGRSGVGGQLAVGSRAVNRLRPCRVVESGGIPSGLFLSRVINFPVKHSVGNYGRGRHTPAVIGHYSLLAAILISQFKLAKQTRGTERGYPPAGRIEEPVPQDSTYGVSTLFKHIGHIIGKIHNTVAREIIINYNPVFVKVMALGVICEIWHQQVIANLFAVNTKLKITEARDKRLGLYQFIPYIKISAQQRSRIVAHPFLRVDGLFGCLTLPGCANPTCLPPRRVGETHSPLGRLAPFRRHTIIVPHHHAPVIILSVLKHGSVIINKIVPVRHDFTRIPDIIFTLGKLIIR